MRLRPVQSAQQCLTSKPSFAEKREFNSLHEAFRLVWLAFCMCGLFAVSVPRWVLGLGHGHFYSILLALSFGSTISPGFFGFYSKGIPMAHASFCPPHPERNGAMGFQNLALVDDVALIGVDEGLCLLWSSILCSPCLTAACLVALRCRTICGSLQLR